MLSPSTSREIGEIVRAAAAIGGALRPQGAGTWLDAGHPVRNATPLSLASLRGVVAYNPGDLTLTVEAGTTLAELDEVTRAHQQWCPLLPWGGDLGTVGGTIATASAGPFSATLGRPRDLVLGMEVVDGNGRVIAAGGRVVKNVAGFDLTRAFTGSWGTLAVITRLHLRLRARPTVDETWALAGSPGPDGVALAHSLRDLTLGPLAPLACEPLDALDAEAMGVGEARWLLRIGGNAEFVAASRAAIASLGTARQGDAAAWDALRRRRAPEALATHWRWDVLSRRLKAAFDPRGVLNPGLLGDVA